MTLPAYSADDVCKLIGVTAVSIGYVMGVWNGKVSNPQPPGVAQALATANDAKRTADETKQRLDAAMKPKTGEQVKP